MDLIRPITIDDADFVSSDVTEADETKWDGTGGLATDTLRMVVDSTGSPNTITHKIYKVTSGGDSSQDPTIDDGTNWTEVSSTNRWKMFDNIIQDQTENSGGFETVVDPGEYTTCIAFLNLDVASLDLVITSSADGEVYNESFNLVSDSGVQDWYSYFFEPIVRTTDLIVCDLPAYIDAEISMTFNDTGTAKVGSVQMGTDFNIGYSLVGASFGIKDYSKKVTDANGRATITEGAYAKRARVDVEVSVERMPEIHRLLAAYRSTPAVWVADKNNSPTIVFGFYKQFETIIRNRTIAVCSLEIEGLI